MLYQTHPLYRAYRDMLSRCNNPNFTSYPNYGGRGIKICERWLGRDGFEHFVNDMGERPSPTHTLDRIDNDGNYEPSNCRWATKAEQAANRRVYKNNKSGHTGVSWLSDRSLWRAAIMRNRVQVILGNYPTLDEAITARRSAEKAAV